MATIILLKRTVQSVLQCYSRGGTRTRCTYVLNTYTVACDLLIVIIRCHNSNYGTKRVKKRRMVEMPILSIVIGMRQFFTQLWVQTC